MPLNLRRPSLLWSEPALAVFGALLVTLWGLWEANPQAGGLKPLTALEHTLLDLRFRLRGPLRPPETVAIITIDDRSMKVLGKWPWPRSIHGRFLRALKEQQPAAIGLDILFMEADAPGEAAALDRLAEHLGRERAGAPEEIDALLADVALLKRRIASDPEFLDALNSMEDLMPAIGFECEVGARPLSQAQPSPELMRILAERGGYEINVIEQIKAEEKAGMTPLQRASELKLPIRELAESVGALGHVAVKPDEDGIVRQIPLGMWSPDRSALYMPLSMSTLILYYLSFDENDPRAVDHEVRMSRGAGAYRMGPTSIPLTEGAQAVLNYYGGHGAFTEFPYIDVLEGKVPPGALSGKALLVGSTTEGLHDHYPNPFDPIYPGVATHATFVANALEGSFLRKVTIAGSEVAYLIGTLCAAALIGAATRWRALAGAVAAAALAAGWVVACHIAFREHTWLHATTPLVAIGLGTSAAMVRGVVRQERARAQLKEMFGPMVSHDVMEVLMKDPRKVRLGAEEREITCTFTDLAGFTSLSEALPPHAVEEILSEYFTQMSAAIKGEGGYVDKYMGDGVMAEFGALIASPGHALQACRAALDQKRRLQGINDRLKARGLMPVDLRIGIHSGLAKVGNFGSADRFNYTAMGDMVNLASRLEGVNKLYETTLLASEETVRAAGAGVAVRELDRIRVVGKGEPTRIFELLENGVGPHHRHYADGLQRYLARDWPGAMEAFRQALALEPEDGPSKVMLERCETYQADPPPPDWDGLYTMKQK